MNFMESDRVHWYPGHMVKARKIVEKNLRLVDLVIELLDARIPVSSRNPEIDSILGNKPRIIVLNKADLADQRQTEKWRRHFSAGGYPCIPLGSRPGRGINELIDTARELAGGMFEKLAAKGRKPRLVRLMMVGIPNVGKSSLINRLAGRGAARTEDRPGVTRGYQWIRVGKGLEMLDTPGILWPNQADPEVGFKLAVTGAVKDEVINLEQVAVKLIRLLTGIWPEKLRSRYKLDTLAVDPGQTLQEIGVKRGFLMTGGQVDTLRTAVIVLNEFRAGKIGLFTLDEID